MHGISVDEKLPNVILRDVPEQLNSWVCNWSINGNKPRGNGSLRNVKFISLGTGLCWRHGRTPHGWDDA